jgi:hypothetical protein
MRYFLIPSLLLTSTVLAEAPDTHPILSNNGTWVPILLFIIGGMFLAAAVIGPIVRANTPEEVPPAHSHDEPPGTSHHHGASGTLNPAPENELHHH